MIGSWKDRNLQPFIDTQYPCVALNLNNYIKSHSSESYLVYRMDRSELSVHGYGKNFRCQMCPEKVRDQLVYVEVGGFHPHLG